MSEFSASYHIRTDDPIAAKQRIRRAGFAGIVFGPAHGWLTFIPYEGLKPFRDGVTFEAFASQLSRALGTTVLHYHYAEDHGWGFALAQPGRSTNRFACWWDPTPTIERDQLNLDALAPFVETQAIKPLLQPVDADSIAAQSPAYRFAELLRLPAYRWLSPNLAQHHTSDLVAQGGSKLGTKPPNAAERLRVPPARKLVLPTHDLSIRQALELVRPFMAKHEPPWFLTGAFVSFSSPTLKPAIWDFFYGRKTDADSIRASLHPNGNLSFRGETAFFGSGMSAPAPLPSDWLDSVAIDKIIREESTPFGFGGEYGLSMSLRATEGDPLLWQASRHFIDAVHFKYAVHSFAVDAITGEIVFETFEQQQNGQLFDTRHRLRWKGEDWKKTSRDQMSREEPHA